MFFFTIFQKKIRKVFGENQKQETEAVEQNYKFFLDFALSFEVHLSSLAWNTAKCKYQMIFYLGDSSFEKTFV